jgi:hypothetical protein
MQTDSDVSLAKTPLVISRHFLERQASLEGYRKDDGCPPSEYSSTR